jgi:hypothetical protein
MNPKGLGFGRQRRHVRATLDRIHRSLTGMWMTIGWDTNALPVLPTVRAINSINRAEDIVESSRVAVRKVCNLGHRAHR